MRRVYFVVVALVVLGAVSSAYGQDACRFVPISPLPGNEHVMVYDINDWGQVIGQSFTRDANGVAHGQKSFVWSHGDMRVLGPLQEGAAFTVPTSINEWGQVVGQSEEGGSGAPVLWTARGVTRLPGKLGDRPTVINNLGQIVGTRQDLCIFWKSPTSEPTLPGTLGGATCAANGLNDRGDAVGGSTDAAGRTQGFLWRGGALEPLGALRYPEGPEPLLFSFLRAINNQGLSIGYAQTARGEGVNLLRWTGRGESSPLPSGLVASSLNDWSWIAALRSPRQLVLISPAGQAIEKGELAGDVNGDQVYINNRFQIAWTTNGLASYFCQLSPR